MRHVRGRLLSATALAALVGWGVLGFASPVSAQLPTGGTVVGGQATIATGPTQVTVTQSTNRGVIDWRSFSIGPNGRVDFQQPGASSVTLNRVTGPDPSVIAGQLTANGQIVLVNGAGVFFANGAQVNVGALVASTANISNPQRFMDGGAITFDVPSPNADARVENAGTITVREGGLVGLVGHSASNSGVINARLGRVTLGGAETFTVDLAGDGLINFQIGQPVSRQPRDAQGRKVALASNTGTINADGGVVTMTARAAGSVVDNVVNVGGAIRAQAVSQEGGVLILDGGDGGTVNISGTLDVSGKGADQRGGQVTATARGGRVNVAASTVIDASGDSGGGRVSIGGSYQGKGPVANARDTNVAVGTRINADAIRQGDGGRVVVWADNATVFGGTISARGGPQGGAGGFVETSGKATLSILEGASVNASATAGRAGEWLLDPTDMPIDAALATTFGTTLQSGTNVTVTTQVGGADQGDITLLTGATIAWTSTAILTFNADRNIVLDGSIAGTNAGAGDRVILNAALTNLSGFISSSAGGTINVGGGTLAITAGTGGVFLSSAAVTAGTVNFNSAADVFIFNTGNAISTLATQPSSVATGSLLISSTLPLTIAAGGITVDSFVTLQSAGQILVSGNIASTSTSGGVSLQSTGLIGGVGGILQTAGTISSVTRVRLAAQGGTSVIQTGGNIVTPLLNATADGTVQLPGTGNDVNFIYGSAGTDFRYVDANLVVLGATDDFIRDITIGAGRYLDVSANAIAIFPTSLIGAVTGSGADNPTGVTVLRPTAAGTAMVIGGTSGTGLTAPVLTSFIRTGTLRIGSIGRADGTVLGAATTTLESAAGAITVQALDLTVSGSAIRTLVLESGAAGTAIGQTGALSVNALATAVVGNGAVELTQTNSVAALAHIARVSDTTLGTQTGTYRYVDGTSIPVVSVGATTSPLVGARDSGNTPGAPANTAILTSGGNVTLVSLDGDIEFINALSASNATVRLNAASDIFQQATGGVVAGNLLAVAGGFVDLTTAPTLNNVQNIAGTANGDFRLINTAGVTVPAGGVAGDSLVSGVGGVAAGTASTLELAIASGDIVVNGTLAAPDGLILLRRVLGAVGSEIVLNGTSFNTGSTPPNLVILDLTGSPALVPGNFAALMTSVTPPNGTSSVPPGPNTDGTITLNGVIAGNTTIYLIGGSGASVGGSGTFGLLGVYVQHSNPIALTGSVRQIDPTTAHSVTANFNEAFDSTTFAGFYVRRSGAVVDVQTFNTCPIASGICPIPSHTDIPTVVDWWPSPHDRGVPVGVLPPVRIDVASDRGPPTPLNLSTIILINQGNEYFFNVDEETRKARAARGGQ